MHKTFLLFCCLVFGTARICCTVSAAERKIVCSYYDLTDNSGAALTDTRLTTAAEQIKNSEADVVVLAGMDNETSLHNLISKLTGFIFSSMVNAEDKSSHLALISKIKPKKFEALRDITYSIKKDVRLPVRHGFIYAVFNIDGYTLHLFGACLKDRTGHPLYSQYDMRRYEARELRKLITALIKKEKYPNVLLLAGLNDTCGKSPVKDIYNRRFGIEKRLFDLRPVDSINVSWTALDELRDEYERIDYAIVSSGLIPEVDLDETMIIEHADWRAASSHRPLIVTVKCTEQPLWTKEKLDNKFPHTIRNPGYNIGQKRKRGTPVNSNKLP